MSNASQILGGVIVNRFLRIIILVLIVCFVMSPLSLGMAANNPMMSPQDKIIAVCSDTIADNPSDFVAYYSRGTAYAMKKMLDEAISDYSKAIEINPDFAAAYNARGLIYYQRKKYDAAIDDYTQAVKIDAAFAMAYTNRAYAYNVKEQYDLAIADSTKAIELSPKMPGAWAYNAKGYAHYMKHQYNEALEAFRTLIVNSTDAATIEQAKGYIRSMGGSV